MRQTTKGLLLSASDLTNHLGCRHLTELNRKVAEKTLARPQYHDHALKLLQERGDRFERDYVAHLESTGAQVLHLGVAPDLPRGERDAAWSEAERKTLRAMQDSVDYIIQARLRTGSWMGVADVLMKVDGPSALGAWHYEPIDTKLAMETRGATVLQLCLYADLIGAVQKRAPERFYVVKPGQDWKLETFRFEEFDAYYRLVRHDLEATVAGAPAEETYPDPVEKCDTCAWFGHCMKQRRADDHLSLVAGMSRGQTGELNRQGIASLEQYAERDEPLKESPARGSRESYVRTHLQAQIQLRGRRRGGIPWEFVDYEPERGLALLPTPDPGDVFFDIESDNFVEGGGLEYLLGVWFEEHGAWHYRTWWAHDRPQEKDAFEGLVDWLMQRWEQYPDFHIYHYSSYEKATLSRLMGRHGSRETEVDRLLRGDRFVDLHAVLKHGIRAGVEGYGLKDIEPLIGYDRKTPLEDARAALRVAAWCLELGTPENIGDQAAVVEAYNREDCEATQVLRSWLEDRRKDLVDTGLELERPVHGDGRASDDVEEEIEETRQVVEHLLEGLPPEPEERSDWEGGLWLLAHMLEYHRREERVTIWEKFFRSDMDREGLEKDRHGIAGLEFVETVGLSKTGIPINRYTFPPQDLSLDPRNSLFLDAETPLGSVEAIDLGEGTIDIKHRGDTKTMRPDCGFTWSFIGSPAMKASLLELGRSLAEGGPPDSARLDLLTRRPPRLRSGARGLLRDPDEPLLDAAKRLAHDLDGSVLPIQGPPGSGKTYIGARMIVDLARAGKRVGVTAVSHKVIENLLEAALTAAAEEGYDLTVAHKGAKSGDLPNGYERLKGNEHAVPALDDGKVVGGTVFLWSRPELEVELDYLFVDEAGQMALANTLAAGRAAKNIVLLGDPQQLEQPQRGAHPEGAEVATLVHVLGGLDTIPDDRGLFLDETWRLHPDICAFTSAVYYDGRLEARPGLDNQVLSGQTPFAGAGLFHVPVPHTGNQSNSPEEVEAVAAIVRDLTGGGVTWTDSDGITKPVTLEDILIVAPYNSQVGALERALPGARVGTVDRFQGQEAPVVIYSMTSSSATDAPRGMSFLYSPNRLNVATSRAQCACFLVAAPAVLEPECRTPRQMRWANGVCRFREMAGVV